MRRYIVVLASLFFLTTFNSCGLLHHHTAVVYNKAIEKAPYDVIIVPGLPYDTTPINPILKGRILWAKELYESGIASNIIFSGSAVHKPYVEGMIMKMMADSLGIPTQHTFIEDKAHHGYENVDLGVALAHRLRFKKIAVATDPIQSIWLTKHLRKNHENVSLIPFSMKNIPQYHKTNMPAINHQEALVKNFIPLNARKVELP